VNKSESVVRRRRPFLTVEKLVGDATDLFALSSVSRSFVPLVPSIVPSPRMISREQKRNSVLSSIVRAINQCDWEGTERLRKHLKL